MEFCDVLRDDGLSYGDYLEQLTYLLFLKMADEQQELLGGERVVPIEFDWQSLLARSGPSWRPTTATRWRRWGRR